MATAKSEAKAKVTLDSSNFEKGAKAITNAAEAMSAAVATALAATGIALLAVFGAKSLSGIKDSIKEVLTLGEEMANAGHAANIAAGHFYLFHNAVEKGLSLKTVASLLGDNAEVLNRSASIFRDVSIKLWAVGEKIKGFWLGLVDRLAPVLSRLLDGALANSLVSAGQAFGDAIADAMKVVYQLAEDGNLWQAFKNGFKLAFDYAAERMLWLGGIGYEILEVIFSKAFENGVDDGISEVWESMKRISSSWQEMLSTSFFNIWTNIEELVNGMLNKIDKALEALNLIPEGTADRVDTLRKRHIAERDLTAKGSPEFNAPSEGGSFFDKVKDIISKNQFSPSDDLSSQIEKFSDTISESLTKYNRDVSDTPTKTFENNTRRAAFGADSLASIGAGGNVYTGLSVLDVNKAQLNELKEINAKLSGRGGDTTDIYNGGSNRGDGGISRAQTFSPVS